MNIVTGFSRTAEDAPDLLAVSVEGLEYSYGTLRDTVCASAGWILARCGTPRHVAVLASRSYGVYAGILAAGWAGAAYVPLSPKLPEIRLKSILSRLRPEAIIVDNNGLSRVSSLRQGEDTFPPVLLISGKNAAEVSEEGSAVIDTEPALKPAERSASDIAYIMFTSGTTGEPKGVMVPCGAVERFMSVMQERYRLTPADRLSQTFETTFDLSVFDMFMTWRSGASLHVLPATQLMAPRRFIVQNNLTVWFSVPSTAALMDRMNMLPAGIFPSLRLSLFCGEALGESTALAWRRAAPKSVVENLYGPTEATIACTLQPVDDPPYSTPGRGVIAIGQPYPGTDAAIFGPNLQPLEDGQSGELVLGGAQLAAGYFGDSERTAAAFPVIHGKCWYRTGDLAYRDSQGVFHHLGRIDNQVKVLGNRVELEEVDAHLRRAAGTDLAASVAWPLEDNGAASGIVAFVAGSDRPADDIRNAMRAAVPAYMVPSRICVLDRLPLNASGKTDRKALVAMLKEGV